MFKTHFLLPALMLFIINTNAAFHFVYGAQDTPEALSERVGASLALLRDAQARTIVIHKIAPRGGMLDTREMVDLLHINLVRSGRLKVVDRTKLDVILNEQRIQLSQFVSAQQYQQLGRLVGVDIFVYGAVYTDTLLLKGLDAQTSALAWADWFPLSNHSPRWRVLRQIGRSAAKSLGDISKRLEKAGVKTISVWNLRTGGVFSSQETVDHLVVALARDSRLNVVDRERLDLAANEQLLNQETFVDQKQAKQLGELYGVDGFLYGNVTIRGNGDLWVALKLLNVYTGVIEWADLIKVKDAKSIVTKGLEGHQHLGNTAISGGAVLINAGSFLMGSNQGNPASRPLHRRHEKDFMMDVEEVSNAAYTSFLKRSNRPPPVAWSKLSQSIQTKDLPVVGVTWYDANAYCEHFGKTLPTEAQWEKAARGPKGRTWPWAEKKFSQQWAVTRERGVNTPSPVDKPGADISTYGVGHMAGNVREWTKSPFTPYPSGPKLSKNTQGHRVIRGGSWANLSSSARSYHRTGSDPRLAWPDVGFRCVK